MIVTVGLEGVCGNFLYIVNTSSLRSVEHTRLLLHSNIKFPIISLFYLIDRML